MSGHWARGYLGLAGADQNGGNGGGGGGSLAVRIVGDSPTSLALDNTWQEIYDALAAGRYVLGLDQYEGGVTQHPINNAEINGSDYCVSVGNQVYTANSADGYPALGT